MRGRVAVAWHKQDGALHLKVTVPPGSCATVNMPANYSRNVISIPPIKPRKTKHGTTFEVKSGTCDFRSKFGN